MRVNGHIQILQPSTGRFDELGNPVIEDAVYGDEMECCIQTVNDNRKGRYIYGMFRQSSYYIFIESCNVTPASATMIKIERNGEYLGEFNIQSVEELSSVGRIKITV